MPIILWQKCEGWETVSAYGEESVRISAPDINTIVFTKAGCGQKFLKFKKGSWKLI